MEREKEGRQGPLAESDSTNSFSGSNDNNSSSSMSGDNWMTMPGASAADCDDEIERPRLEDSRASLVLHMPPDLALLVPNARHLRPQDPLLSSTMVQDPAGQSSLDAAAVQDWPNTSSIRMGKSNSGNWGNISNSAMEDSLSDRLNNADICLDASVACVSGLSSASASASAAAIAASAPAAAAGNTTSEAISGFDTDSSVSVSASASASVSSASASTNLDVSSPRLRVLAGDSEQHRQDDDQPPQQPQQLALGLLQVCRLTLDVLSEGGLLRDEARGWLTPELLCDKLCDRIYCPIQPLAATSAAAAAAPSAESSIVAPMEFESPVGRVRHWLLADGSVSGGGGCEGGSPLRRHVPNSA